MGLVRGQGGRALCGGLGGGTYLDHKLLPQLVLAILSDGVEDHTVVVGAQRGDGHDPQHLLVDVGHVGLGVLHRHQPLLPGAAGHAAQVAEVLQRPEVQRRLQRRWGVGVNPPPASSGGLGAPWAAERSGSVTVPTFQVTRALLR